MKNNRLGKCLQLLVELLIMEVNVMENIRVKTLDM